MLDGSLQFSLIKATSSWGRTPWRFFLHHYLFWCCNWIGKKYFNIDITLYKLRIASWLFLSVYFITAKFNRSFELDILYWYINAKQLWTRIIRFWKLCFKTLSSNVPAAFGTMRLVHCSFERYESKDWNEWWNVSPQLCGLKVIAKTVEW